MCFVSSGPAEQVGQVGEIFIYLFASVTRHGSVPCSVCQMNILTFVRQDSFHTLLQIGLNVVHPMQFESLSLLPC